ncbi:helix-turn-helix transcriptional regulator [Ureibacillus chungkukjangi]|uniref:AraC family transcriptional regulator n=1 Tax=Ureibacillus chungkukjangi TaxID=1202712 RepID=A0A318TFL5_9BACL|nr:AraC family transcriptional regulator [Ureibacillus chungkukjangi]MCM3387884.1 AraC family transcriptional regulator [Ureibacillus chungkukjangi]PYF03444.1 AraC family transcriptional regulator [Ureibacillus chungkukjangi]
MEHYELIENALVYIEDNIEKSLSLESVSNHFNISKFYFHRLFSAMTGYSFNNYLLSRRLNKSVNLIQNEKLSLTDIAYLLNFGTPSSFTRAFKKQYGIAPSKLKENTTTINESPIPLVVKKPIKNINGDIVTDFTLVEFNAIRVCGIAFEVDLATENYKLKIRSHSRMLLDNINQSINGPCYVIYSNCQPNSTKFNVLFGIPYDIQINKPYYFTNDIPSIFCAKFQYSGDILDIGDVLTNDFARFLKISKLEAEQSDIEMIQAFENVHQLDSSYHLYVPIKKHPIDLEC